MQYISSICEKIFFIITVNAKLFDNVNTVKTWKVRIMRKRGQNIFLPNAFDDKLYNDCHNGELLTRSYNSDAIQA